MPPQRVERSAFITSGLPHFDVNFLWDAAGYVRIALC
jgi:hypothetical protein